MVQGIVLIFTLLGMNSGMAARPTIEGLFRNGDNAELIGETSIIAFEIESLNTLQPKASESTAPLDEDELNDSPKPLQLLELPATTPSEVPVDEKRYIKLHFRQMANGRTKLLQAEYSGAEMNSSELLQIKKYKNFGRKLAKEERDNTNLFYSLVMMFALNESKPLSRLFKMYNLDFLENREVMNEEKVKLYQRYKEYLTSIKEDKYLKDELVSPMAPEEVEEKTLIQEILSSAMYRSSDRIKLVQQNGDFFWQLSLEKTMALFFNHSHRLQMLHTQFGAKRYVIYCGEYVLYNGVHSLPQNIRIELDDGTGYIVKIIKYSNFEDRKRSFNQRVDGYNKILSKLQTGRKESGQAAPPPPSFRLLNFIY